MDTNVTVIQAAAALFGFGYALLLSSAFTRIKNITMQLGYEENTDTIFAIQSKFVNIKLFDHIKCPYIMILISILEKLINMF